MNENIVANSRCIPFGNHRCGDISITAHAPFIDHRGRRIMGYTWLPRLAQTVSSVQDDAKQSNGSMEDSGLAETLPVPGHSYPETVRGIVIFCHGYNHRIDNFYAQLAGTFNSQGLVVIGVDQLGHGASEGKRCHIDDFDDFPQTSLMHFDKMIKVVSSYIENPEHTMTHIAQVVDAANQNSKELTSPDHVNISISNNTQEDRPAQSNQKDESSDVSNNQPISSDMLAANLPVFVYGESMGGAIALRMFKHRPDAFRGLILFAPMCGVDPALVPPSIVVSSLRCLEKIIPRAPIVPGEDHTKKCFKDPRKLEVVLKSTDRYVGRMRLRMGLQLITACQIVQDAAPQVTVPIAIFHGTNDEVTDPKISRKLFDACASTDKTYFSYENGFHGLWWEQVDTRRSIGFDVLNWINLRLQSDIGKICSSGIAYRNEGQEGFDDPYALLS